MYSLEAIFGLFPGLTDNQKIQFAELLPLYRTWNERINVISRKDMENFYSRHVLHSLAIGHYHQLDDGPVLDVGTGGGFPGIPLAILFPETHFTLLDSIRKKLRVVEAVKDHLELDNVTTLHSRMEDVRSGYRYITGRAVKSFPQIFQWLEHLIPDPGSDQTLDIFYLKGGDFNDELSQVLLPYTIHELDKWLEDDPFFETKKLVHFYTSRS
ncbi:MAG: 16S rRNA (guanine(527)-N(7))-methyltransferase RsmG [Flavobacteriales bacterium]|nr:16S rRNA (guanine(527)-N(7))-methyltransferase RsmG [Flavobacteriales bacterium]